jgi:hypothetical protein
MQHTLFIARDCSNCERLIDSIKRSPSAIKAFRVIDIARLDQQTLSRLHVVPTIQTDENEVLEGSRAFEFVNENYHHDTPLEGVGMNSSWFGSSLECTDLNDGGAHTIHPWESIDGI